MRRMILLIVVVVFLVAVLGPVIWGFGAKAAPPKPGDDTAVIMQKKLAHAQKILEGISLEELDKVGEHAKEMMALSKQAEFMVLKTPQYELQVNSFRRALEDMQKGVKDKNLDTAALAYVDMTMSCVKCHKHVRAVRMAFKN
jgi:hypothetical protein